MSRKKIIKENKHCLEIEKVNNLSKNSYISGGIIEEFKIEKKN